MKPSARLSPPRLWAAALLVTMVLCGADSLLGLVHMSENARTGLSWPFAPIVRHRLQRLRHDLLFVLAPLLTALIDGFIAPPRPRFPSGAQAAALTASTASLALLVPLSYGVPGACLFVAVLAILLRRVRTHTR